VRTVTRSLALVLTAVLLAAALSGCTDQTADANAAIGRANEAMGAYAAAGSRLEALAAEARSLEVTTGASDAAREASRGVELAARMAASLAEQRSAAETAGAELAAVTTMSVTPDLKAYAAKEAAVAAALVREEAAARRVVDEMRKLYGIIAAGKPAKEAVAAATAGIDQGTRDLALIEGEVMRLEREADAFFRERKLGRR
jgi:hypothetical protein